uniref:Putative CENPB/ARS binding proteinlike protein n=1 Tax=Albugo laibachii Nc14 TaxID=890382 RepID=F0WNR7_9STRA|nr:putative CENPB/ARS binding proteinlike protein [Albugo laibachii Nc14]|eukprot:CCA22959.1 putative CENPB/ARS binding proteinlike protein [Albugo laibachii Nc14]
MTLYRVLNNHVSASDSNSARKIKYRVTSPELEERLLLWICQCEQYKLPIVTGAIIRAKADKIRRELIISTPDESAKLNALVFLPGWLSKFHSRHRLTSKRVHGKVVSVSRAAVEKGGAALLELTRGYERHNVFNMDDTAFFFCAPTTKPISTQRMAERKQQKKRLTVTVCCNADGPTKEQLGLHYEYMAKGWMSSQLFQLWLSHINDQMRTESRHVILLVDNVTSHRPEEAFSHVELRMFPPSTTAFLQPQDAGIISSFKAQIRKIQHHYIADRFDDVMRRISDTGDDCVEKKIDPLFNVDVLIAMRWAETAWSMVTRTTILHYWRHTQILDEEIHELVESFEKLRASAIAAPAFQ